MTWARCDVDIEALIDVGEMHTADIGRVLHDVGELRVADADVALRCTAWVKCVLPMVMMLSSTSVRAMKRLFAQGKQRNKNKMFCVYNFTL